MIELIYGLWISVICAALFIAFENFKQSFYHRFYKKRRKAGLATASVGNDYRDKFFDRIYNFKAELGAETIIKLGNFKDKTILIAGAGGVIGAELSLAIAELRPLRVVLLDMSEKALEETKKRFDEFLFYEINFILCDIRNGMHLDNILYKYKPNIIFHCADYNNSGLLTNNEFTGYDNNFIATKNFADLAINNNVEKFLFLSSAKANSPSSIYGRTKRLAENYLRFLNAEQNPAHVAIAGKKTRFACIQLFGGSSDSFFRGIRQEILEGKPIPISHPDISSYFLSAREIALQTIAVSTLTDEGDLFDFDFVPFKLNDLVERYAEEVNVEQKRLRVVFVGLGPGEKLYEELINADAHTVHSSATGIMISRRSDFAREDDLKIFENLIKQLDIKNSFEILKNINAFFGHGAGTYLPDYSTVK